MTLKDIRDYQLKVLLPMRGSFEQYEDGHPYDEDGHCSESGYEDILGFWQDFNTDKDFKYLVSGKWFTDDIDLSGGRSYLLSDDKLLDMIFDYMYNTLRLSKEGYSDILFNSTTLSDELYERYDDPSVIRDIKIDSIVSNDVKEVNSSVWDVVFDKTGKPFRSEEIKYEYIPHIIKYSKNMKSILDNCQDLEYIGDSRENSDMICYRIKKLGCRIPSGYDVIRPMDEILNEK